MTPPSPHAPAGPSAEGARARTLRGAGGLLPAGHAMVLGMAAAGAPLGAVLHAVVELVEMGAGGARCSVMLTEDGEMLRVAAAPSLPESITRPLAAGIPVGMGSGSCGESAFTRKAVIDRDVMTSPRWAEYRALAAESGIRSCWSIPILGEGEEPLGAFALYHHRVTEPTEAELQQLWEFAQLVSVAVRQDRTSRALERSKGVDRVTGLPGREHLLTKAQEAIGALAHGGWAAVAAIEMRRLRECNEAFGYAGGDELVLQAASRLKATLGDRGTVFRAGGSGFAAVLTDPLDAQGRPLPEQMLRALRAPMTIAGAAFTPSPRIGLAVAPPDIEDPVALVESAQIALSQARLSTAPTVVQGSSPARGKAARNLRLESDLRRGLATGEMIVHYQPQYALDTGRIVGVEALVRWQHPEQGLLQPGEFLHAVESGSLHGDLLDLVVRQACHDAARWRRSHPDLPVVVAVNLAPSNLLEPGMIGCIQDALAASELPGGLLCLEITEQAALLDMEAALDAMEQLKALGVMVAMDDFGTGYSSLAYARRLPIDSLKVDRSFVQRIVEEPQDRAVVAAVVALGNGLGVDVLAEGVETEEQRRVVRELGCRNAQGYLWSAAVPAEAIAELLAAFEDAVVDSVQVEDAAEREDWQDRSDAFLSHVVHEARTPLTVLRLQADTLALQPDNPVHVAAAAASIGRQVVALNEILSATTDVHELGRGTMALHRAPIDLGELAEEVVLDLTDTVPTEVDLQVADGVVAFVDPSRVRQMLVNLLNNAGKYAPAASTVDLRVDTVGSLARVVVRDRGPGVPPDKAHLIFRQFGRADESKPGLGLGLYISRQLARSHGGDLTYQPATPTGAQFEVTLPIAEVV